MEEKALGKRLQDARRKAGLTQQELCQKAALSYSTLAKIERGAIKSPSVFTVAAIAEATDTSVEDLLGIKTHGSGSPAKKTSKSGVQFVYFDLNSTLVRSLEKAFPKIAHQAGLPIDLVEAAFWRYDNEVCDGSVSLSEYNSRMAKTLGLKNFDWTTYYLEAVEPVEGMREFVNWAAQNFHVGLLSGTMPGLIEGLAKAGKLELDKFEVIIDSSVVKCLKDDPQIYKLAQAKAGVPARAILLVDDSKSSLVLADKAGWQVSRFNSYSPKESITRAKSHLEF